MNNKESQTSIRSEIAFIELRRRENLLASQIADRDGLLGSEATLPGISAFLRTRTINPQIRYLVLKQIENLVK